MFKAKKSPDQEVPDAAKVQQKRREQAQIQLDEDLKHSIGRSKGAINVLDENFGNAKEYAQMWLSVTVLFVITLLAVVFCSEGLLSSEAKDIIVPVLGVGIVIATALSARFTSKKSTLGVRLRDNKKHHDELLDLFIAPVPDINQSKSTTPPPESDSK